jgi:DNA repair protein SbcD/Mre11
MPRFAHMSDVHIGAFRQPELRRLVLTAFDTAIDLCIEKGVAFVILAGDIFDSNIPDLSAVRRAAEKMKEARARGIRFYAIYGSHDFSPNYSSIVDVLDGAGLFTKAEDVQDGRETLALRFVVDPSGAKICGISGKKLSIDRGDYERLDKGPLEEEQGFKIFVFHGAIDELKPPSLAMMEGMPSTYLPSGFSYYAGGHVHDHSVTSLPGRRNIAYPGPLFATESSELRELAHGKQRGFFLVDFDDDVRGVEFVPVRPCEVMEVVCDVSAQTSAGASEKIMKSVQGADASGKVVLLTVRGELSSGRTTDVSVPAAKKTLASRGAICVVTDTNGLSSMEFPKSPVPARPASETERETFEREIRRAHSGVAKLNGPSGVNLAVELLNVLKEGRKENESRADYDARVTRQGMAVLGVEEPG